MGTDIHYVVEELDVETRTWVGRMSTSAPHWMLPTFEERQMSPIWRMKRRNYDFFAALCGVRSRHVEPVRARGLPDNASHATLVDYMAWGSDAHSASYCGLRDFTRIYLHTSMDTEALTAMSKDALLGGDPVMKFLKMDDDEKLDNFRVCYWFDN